MTSESKKALNACLENFKDVPEVNAIYADSMYIFVFYQTPNNRGLVGLLDRLYAIFDTYIDDVAYSAKTIYYIPETIVEEPDDIVQGTPLYYIYSR